MSEQEIGQLFKEKLSGFQHTPSEAVWMKIENDQSLLKFNRKHLFKKALYYASAVVGTVAVVVSAILFSGKEDHGDLQNAPVPPASTETPVIIKKDTPEKTGEIIPEFIVPEIERTKPAKKRTPADEPTSIFLENRPYELGNFNPDPSLNQDPAKYNPAPNQNPVPHKSAQNNQENEPGSNVHGTPATPTAEEIVYSRDTTVCRNSKLVLFVKNALSVHWHAGYNSNTLEVYPSEPGVYYVDVVDHQENKVTLAIRVDVFDCGFFIPNAFTPNGDGRNDEFIVYSPVEVNDFEMSIFDISSGRLVFKTQDVMHGWDGTEGGKELPQGVYVYMITYKDKLNVSKIEKGQVILVR